MQSEKRYGFKALQVLQTGSQDLEPFSILQDGLWPRHIHPNLVFGVTGQEVTVNKAPIMFNGGESKPYNLVLLIIASFLKYV